MRRVPAALTTVCPGRALKGMQWEGEGCQADRTLVRPTVVQTSTSSGLAGAAASPPAPSRKGLGRVCGEPWSRRGPGPEPPCPAAPGCDKGALLCRTACCLRWFSQTSHRVAPAGNPSALPSTGKLWLCRSLQGPRPAPASRPRLEPPLGAPRAPASLASLENAKSPLRSPTGPLHKPHLPPRMLLLPARSLPFPSQLQGLPRPPVCCIFFLHLFNSYLKILFISFTFIILLFILHPEPCAEQVLDDSGWMPGHLCPITFTLAWRPRGRRGRRPREWGLGARPGAPLMWPEVHGAVLALQSLSRRNTPDTNKWARLRGSWGLLCS